MFKEVLVKPKKGVHRSLSRYNRRENRSVERVARTSSPFKKKTSSKPPLPAKTVRKLKPKPTFDIGSNCVYLTEKEENFRWNDITSKELEEKVRSSIEEVDRVLKLDKKPPLVKSVSCVSKVKTNINPENTSEPCQTPSPRASFKKFRQLLKSNNLVLDETPPSKDPKVESKESLELKDDL